MEFLNYLAIIPILGFLMIAHELGHFIVAKRSGITVEEFAIGFGAVARADTDGEGEVARGIPEIVSR